MEINWILPKPISVNTAYAGIKIRHKSNAYKKWIKEADKFENEPFIIEGDEWLEVEYKFFIPLICKTKDQKKKEDVGNLEKVLSDYLVEKIPGFKDEHIKKLTLEKINSDKNIVKIKIREYA